MLSTGIVRKVDPLGRIVVPKELRRTLDINTDDPMEIFVDGDKVILQKYVANRACYITGEVTDENIEVADGLFLSPEGIEIMRQKLDNK